MARKRLEPYMIVEIVRHRLEFHRSVREITAITGRSVGYVGECCARIKELGWDGWPPPVGTDGNAIAQALFPLAASPVASRPVPDFAKISVELRAHKGVTLQLLWQEYQNSCLPGECYGYSQFCYLYGEWRKHHQPSMRQIHVAGEKMFVDYAGKRVPIHDEATGSVYEAQLFVATLGASSYTFAEVTASQKLDDWLGSHERAFAFWGGVPQLVIPDNLRSAVTKSCRYEPLVNRSYEALLEHYGTVAAPTRPVAPKDKAKVEVGVQVAERWILAVLRHRLFFSLSEANVAVAELLAKLNARVMRHVGQSRRQLYERLDQPALRPLPQAPYEYAYFFRTKATHDYHVGIDGNYYSVPYSLANQEIEVRLTARIVEILQNRARVAVHERVAGRLNKTQTLAEHRPANHRAYAEWQEHSLMQWAGAVGVETEAMVKHLLATRPYPQTGWRSCQGLKGLAQRFGGDRLEAACQRANEHGIQAYNNVKSILHSGLDKLPPQKRDKTKKTAPPNDTVRGAEYYQ